MGFFSGKKITQEPLESPQAVEAKNLLLQLAKGQNVGGFTSGQAYGGSLGDFALRGIEQSAGGSIADRLGGGGNANVNNSTKFLTDIASQGFDPNSQVFQSFQKALARSTKDASTVLDREAAITGNRFGTAIGQEKGLLAERQSDLLGQQLGQLFNEAQNRSLGAASQLGQLGLQEDQNARANEGLALAYGQLERGLKDAEAKSKLSEFMRQRQERIGSFNGLPTAAQPVQFGVKSVKSQSPFSQLLNTGLRAGAAYLTMGGSEIANAASGGSLFGGGAGQGAGYNPFG